MFWKWFFFVRRSGNLFGIFEEIIKGLCGIFCRIVEWVFDWEFLLEFFSFEVVEEIDVLVFRLVVFFFGFLLFVLVEWVKFWLFCCWILLKRIFSILLLSLWICWEDFLDSIGLLLRDKILVCLWEDMFDLEDCCLDWK